MRNGFIARIIAVRRWHAPARMRHLLARIRDFAHARRLAIQDWPLPYEARLEGARCADVDLVVIHCTELPDMKIAREFGEKVRYERCTGNSGHYYVDFDGTRAPLRRRRPRRETDVRLQPALDRHRDRQHRPLSVLGRQPHQAFTEPYTKEQIDALLALLRQLRNDMPKLRYIAGHEDLDRRLEPASDDPAILLPRRQDPGPLFPWDEIVPVADWSASSTRRTHRDPRAALARNARL